MLSNKIDLKQELHNYNYSIDDFFIRIIIYMYEDLKLKLKEEYPNKYNIQKHQLQRLISHKHIKITRQTIYNIVNNKNDVSLDKAILILNVLNEIRLDNGKLTITLDDLSFNIYKK